MSNVWRKYKVYVLIVILVIALVLGALLLPGYFDIVQGGQGAVQDAAATNAARP